MKSKNFLPVLLAFLCAAILFWWNRPGGWPAEAEAAEDEILLRIKLDTKEDFGLLIIDYKDTDGSGGQGGISNVDKSLLKHSEQLFYALPRHAFDNPSDMVTLSIQFKVITQYFDPNYDNIYPAEYTIPMAPLSLNANFGETCSIIIRGDMANGYQAVWDNRPS